MQEIIYWGAKVAMIPNSFPLGCLPSFLSRFHSEEPKDYDENGCLKWFNDFSRTHNDVLLMEVNRLREFYPGVKFIYADYYAATIELIKNAPKYGKHFFLCSTSHNKTDLAHLEERNFNIFLYVRVFQVRTCNF